MPPGGRVKNNSVVDSRAPHTYRSKTRAQSDGLKATQTAPGFTVTA